MKHDDLLPRETPVQLIDETGATVTDEDFEREHIKPEQDARFEADIWEEPIRDYLEGKERVLVVEVAKIAVGAEIAKVGTADQRRITGILERLGWKRGKMDWKGNRWWTPCS